MHFYIVIKKEFELKVFALVRDIEKTMTLFKTQLDEKCLGVLNSLVICNSYPESKRMCEMICNAYAKEYAVNTTSIRLAQTFGPGVAYEDKRIFAMMAR